MEAVKACKNVLAPMTLISVPLYLGNLVDTVVTYIFPILCMKIKRENKKGNRLQTVRSQVKCVMLTVMF